MFYMCVQKNRLKGDGSHVFIHKQEKWLDIRQPGEIILPINLNTRSGRWKEPSHWGDAFAPTTCFKS